MNEPILRGRRRVAAWVLAALVGAATAGDGATGEGWRLIYADDFGEGEVSDAWIRTGSKGDRSGRLVVENGRLRNEGPSANAMLDFRLPADVKVEWTGFFPEGHGRSMVQHSVGVRGVPFLSHLSGVHFVHGRKRNSLNRIEAKWLAEIVAKNAGPLPKAGETYAFEATLEGDRARFRRDGELLLEGRVETDVDLPLGDRVIFALGPDRIRIDEVRVYAKGGPPEIVPARYPLPRRLNAAGRPVFAGEDADGRLAEIARLDHAGRSGAALEKARALPDGRRKLDALMLLAARPGNHEFGAVCRAVADLLGRRPELAPGDDPGAVPLRTAALRAASAARIVGGIQRPRSALDGLWLLPRLGERHPLRANTTLGVARSLYWNYRESGSPVQKREGERLFTRYLHAAPDDPLARMYLGEDVLWAPELASRSGDAPLWAQTVRELHERGLRIIRWWDNRQAGNGSLGGGWGDDVELTRSWAPLVAITEDTAALGVLMDLIEGAWRHAEGGLEKGYTTKMFDVQHTAEPTADTQPWLLLFEPGKARSVGRNRKLLPLVRDLWTTRDPEGYRRFRSLFFTAAEVDPSRALRADTPYHTRAYKGLTWLAWHGDDPEVERVWLQLCDAWLEAAMREAKGKLAGVVPAAVDPKTGELGAPKGTSWWDVRYSDDLYDFNVANHMRVLRLLTAAYAETGEKRYLAPLFRCLDIWRAYGGGPAREPEAGSEAWQRQRIHRWGDQGFYAPLVMRYRRLSGDASHDDYLLAERDYGDTRFGGMARRLDAVMRYQMTGEIAPVREALDAILESELRYNFPMLTREVQSTDRASIPGSEALYALMTGATAWPGDPYPPDLLVSWEHRNADFAAAVRSKDPGEVSIRFRNFDVGSDRYALRLWSLPFGPYELEVRAEGGTLDRRTVEHTEPGQRVPLELPAGKPIQITLVAKDG